TVTAAVNYKPLVTSNSMKLYVAVLEDTTIKNVKNNGEVRFMSVMKKMLPNEFGTVINTPVNTPATLNFNYTFNGNYRLPANAGSPINHATENSVEFFHNLYVVAWVQDTSTKQVMQAINLTGSATGIKDF